jgi:hypothetical protein
MIYGSGQTDYDPNAPRYSAAKAKNSRGKKIVIIQAPQRTRTLPGLSLSLYEQLAHIPRGLKDDLVGNFSRISGKVMRSKSR